MADRRTIVVALAPLVHVTVTLLRITKTARYHRDLRSYGQFDRIIWSVSSSLFTYAHHLVCMVYSWHCHSSLYWRWFYNEINLENNIQCSTRSRRYNFVTINALYFSNEANEVYKL